MTDERRPLFVHQNELFDERGLVGEAAVQVVLAADVVEAAAALAQALANNPIRRDLIERSYALLKGLQLPTGS